MSFNKIASRGWRNPRRHPAFRVAKHEHESFDELMSRLACRMRKAAAPLFSSLILLIFQPYFAGFRSLTTHMVLVDELHPAISSALCLWGVAGIDQALNRIGAEGSHFAAWLTKL
jgi:hypothetical protein